MRKIVLLAAAMLVMLGAQAQGNGYNDTKHEVSVSIGANSNSQWIDVFEDVTVVAISGAIATFDNDHYVGPLSAEYFYHAKPWLGVGGIFAFGYNKQDVLFDGKKDGEMKHTYYTLMPAVKLDWLRKTHFGMYSKLAVGMTLRTESIDDNSAEANTDSNTMTHVNWQVSLLGIEAGPPTIRGFAEFGLGEQGMLLAGVRYKF